MASSPLFIKFKDTYSLLSYATEVIGIHQVVGLMSLLVLSVIKILKVYGL